MAINSYSTLQTAVANWLDRDDLSDRIPEFIALNEAVFNRVLRLRAMENITTSATVSGTKSYDLPTGYVQMREIHLDTSPITSVQYYVMTYYKKFDSLSDSTTTNWIILNAPDVYLYGTLLQAEPFLMNDQRIPIWERGLRQAIADLQEQDDKDRHSGSELRVMNTSGYY
jgi:hypothetical protein